MFAFVAIIPFTTDLESGSRARYYQSTLSFAIFHRRPLHPVIVNKLPRKRYFARNRLTQRRTFSSRRRFTPQPRLIFFQRRCAETPPQFKHPTVYFRVWQRN